MGIITKLSFEQIKNHIKTEYDLELLSCKPTKSGVSDSVYLLQTNGGAFALKLFETADKGRILREHRLLELLSSLPVAAPHTPGHIPTLCGKPSSLYLMLVGSDAVSVANRHCAEIGRFLSGMHSLSASISSDNPSFCEQLLELKASLPATPFSPYGALFDEMLSLPTDGVIHGDLFLDNAVFDDAGLVGVIDFIEAFSGPFAFDVGVAAFSFCVKDARVEPEMLSSMLNAYEFKKYSAKQLLRFMRYAALFYGVNRFIGGRNYEECLSFLERQA